MFLFIAQQQAGAGQTKITSSMWRNTVAYGEWGFAPCRVKQLRSVSNLDPQSKQNLINKQQTTSMQSNQTQPPPKKTHNSQTYPHLQGTKWTLKETLPYQRHQHLLRPEHQVIRLMLQKSGDHQLRLVVYPIIYKVLFIQGGAGFLPSTVSYRIFHQD